LGRIVRLPLASRSRFPRFFVEGGLDVEPGEGGVGARVDGTTDDRPLVDSLGVGVRWGAEATTFARSYLSALAL